ncbi:MAG: alpha/beta fold hydrolase [Gammaproteobacteria bacterium]
MSTILFSLLVFVAAGIGMWVISHVMEGLRPAPPIPRSLRWAPDIPIEYVDVGGNTLRYIKAGSGSALVLLHTLRTQLDLFEKVVAELSKDFTVYALDYPGHGYSDIPQTDYHADFFADAVEGFLEVLDLNDAALAGVSIGGSISLIIAGRGNARVARVVAINPYDYAEGEGMARSSLLGRIIVATSKIPVIGETVMRLRNFIIMKAVLRGGVAKSSNIPGALLAEMYHVGDRKGHYRAFIGLLRNAASWEAATKIYSAIPVPVLLVWGDKDWATQTERDQHQKLIPNVEVVTVEGGGHFLPLDRPNEVVSHIKRFAAASG